MQNHENDNLVKASDVESIHAIVQQFAAIQYELMRKILMDLQKIKNKLEIKE